jgi:Na+/H+ antiporter NhaD/arsenite permease-like protein
MTSARLLLAATRIRQGAPVALGMLLAPASTRAAEDAAPHLAGSELGLLWSVPFLGMLASIALFPLLAPSFWHHHFGKVSALWALAVLVPLTIGHGFALALYEMVHVALLEYIPFIILLFALFTVAGGVRLTGRLKGTPAVNTGLLLLGTVIASWMGTTGAAMLLIRPLLNANENRKYRVHTVVFFIFLVANIGGSLSPLGDPPLFLGFLKGVDFFWPTEHLLLPMAILSIALLAIYAAIDAVLYKREGKGNAPGIGDDLDEATREFGRLGLEGKVNILLLAAIVGVVLLSGVWQPETSFAVYHVEVELQNLVRDLLLVGIALMSLWLTVGESRRANAFTWFPIIEVAKLFAGIFVTIVPVIAILRAGEAGALGGVVDAVTDSSGQPIEAAYFWLTGILSSFLDNAPTYLVFFNTAGGDATALMTEMPGTLAAISAGAVFMGAVTYIGNAPNFMVRSIAIDRGIAMPSFFGYMLWSIGLLMPLFGLVTLMFFV